MTAVELGGEVASGFEAVSEAFARSFAERDELGAAFAVVVDGRTVVDLWGGTADRASGRPWTADTLQILFSGGKGLVAACMLLLVERGALALDEPVAAYWPEFAAAGKDDVLVRHVLSHTSPLPGLDTPVTWREATDDRRMAALLARQRRSDDPRAVRTYHAMTFGWLCGELVRRVDGRSVGRFFADEFATPLALELWIGLPSALEPRVSTVELAPTSEPALAFEPERLAADPLQLAVFGNPRRFDREHFPWNEPAWHAAEVPSSNAIGTARSIARFYADLDTVLSPATLALARTPLSTREDGLLGSVSRFGPGFELQTDDRRLGPPADAFGHTGSGGSRHGAWPSQRLGFSYAMNLLRSDAGDTRAAALLDAVHACLVAGPGVGAR